MEVDSCHTVEGLGFRAASFSRRLGSGVQGLGSLGLRLSGVFGEPYEQAGCAFQLLLLADPHAHGEAHDEEDHRRDAR